MNWIKVETPPREAQHIWITGMSFKGRFYRDAKFIHGKYLMYDVVADDYIHSCEWPDCWAVIESPDGRRV